MPVGRATCPRCGMPRNVRKDGMIAKHTRRQHHHMSHGYSYTTNAPCEGGGGPPRAA